MIIRFVGFGGQGIVLSSYIIGQSAAFDGKQAIQNQSYGSESRGGECRGDVIISEEDIYDLEPTRYDVLIAMTQPGYDKFIGSLKPEGTLIFDQDLVIPENKLNPSGIRTCGVSATEIAFKKLDRKIVANMVMLGYLNSLLNLVSDEALEKAITLSVPTGTVDLNLQALREGISLAASENATA
jgi:2-oxoglutarate ferredoxin oxidoreductase subunit gamma